jgi:hypothetical protein
MLAPGDCLTKPVTQEAVPAPPASRGAEPAPTAAPTGKPDDDESPSFLMILLRALGAFHS